MSTVVKDLGAVSAYAYAVEKGYTGTEAEFAELMADYATVGQTAVTAAQTATTKASEAATSATTATNKASEATTAAQTATTKAAEAQADADAAALDASQALSAASTATTKATEATTAAATATSAATTATTANTAAQSAKTAAQTAQTGAETAAASVQESAAQIATNTDDIAQLKNTLTDMQSDGVVPSAEQILTDKGVTDCVPYHYRKTGGDGADRLYDQIVGGTVCWNQLVQNGNFEDTTSWNSTGNVTSFTVANNKATLVCTQATDNTYIDQYDKNVIGGHKYLVGFDYEKSASSPYAYWGTYPHAFAIQKALSALSGRFEAVVSATVTTTTRIRVGMRDNYATGEWIYSIWNVMMFDLTAMFGSTIADYIYQLEQATAGAGVAFFKALFPNDYYPYNSGELVSVSGLSEHKMVGLNQWDEEWENGYYDADGLPVANTGTIRSKNFIPVLPATVYFAKMSATGQNRICFYDANKNFISRSDLRKSDTEFTTIAGCHYIKFHIDGTTYNHDICINISDPTKNGTYEPYKAHSYPLDSTLTLRGIPKLVDGKMCFDGDTYNADGTVTRKYGIVDLGTLTWLKTGTNAFYINTGLTPAAKVSLADGMNMICAKYPYGGGAGTGTTGKDKVLCYNWNSLGSIIIFDSAYTDAATFKTAMSGVYLVYELATPTTESAQPFTNPQVVDASGTEEYVSTGIVPIGHNSFYPENLRAKIEQLPWNFASLIAPTESAFVATRNYVTGDLFIVDNVLYKATSNIANGGTITPNTNCTATTLAEIISALA